MLGKEMNKEKNKGLLASALSADDDKQTGYNSDESIAEGELFAPVKGNGRLKNTNDITDIIVILGDSGCFNSIYKNVRFH